jgi:hypothetical protein
MSLTTLYAFIHAFWIFVTTLPLNTLHAYIHTAQTFIITHPSTILEPQVYHALIDILFIALVACITVIIRLYHCRPARAAKKAKLHDHVPDPESESGEVEDDSRR